MSENLRRQQRYDRRIEIEVAMGETRTPTFTRNMSLGGVFVESNEHPPFGTRVTLKFKVPTQKEPIEASGVIRWHDGSGFGVQFDGLRARDVWALGKFFEQP
jgi:hypothetical protein